MTKNQNTNASMEVEEDATTNQNIETGNGASGQTTIHIQLTRYDVEPNEIGEEKDIPQTTQLEHRPKDREEFIKEHELPPDSVIKLRYDEKLIPWCMVQSCSFDEGQLLDIQVFRPQQNIKAKLAESLPSDSLIQERVHRLESRIASLEQAVDPERMDLKTEKDLQVLTKQISFLKKRLEEADQADWLKKGSM